MLQVTSYNQHIKTNTEQGLSPVVNRFMIHVDLTKFDNPLKILWPDICYDDMVRLIPLAKLLS